MNLVSYLYVRDRNPVVFNPKVTPDPVASELLEAKLRAATQRLTERSQQGMVRRSLWLRQLNT